MNNIHRLVEYCMYIHTCIFVCIPSLAAKINNRSNLNAFCMSRTVVHGDLYISAVAIYNLEDMIDMHIYAYACSSLLVCEQWYQVLLSIVSSIVLPVPGILVPGSTNMSHRYFCM